MFKSSIVPTGHATVKHVLLKFKSEDSQSEANESFGGVKRIAPGVVMPSGSEVVTAWSLMKPADVDVFHNTRHVSAVPTAVAGRKAVTEWILMEDAKFCTEVLVKAKAPQVPKRKPVCIGYDPVVVHRNLNVCLTAGVVCKAGGNLDF